MLHNMLVLHYDENKWNILETFIPFMLFFEIDFVPGPVKNHFCYDIDV